MSGKSKDSRLALHGTILAMLITLIVICAAVGGFLIGRSLNRVASLVAVGTAPLSLYQAIAKDLDDPSTAQALAKMYDVPPSDQGAIVDRLRLVERLREIIWLPPNQPAPFVGHIARPYSGENLHINALGFRDKREHLENKDDRTVRIFITGGSTAWGSGATSDDHTISVLLEQRLNKDLSPHSGYRYEVINTAFPGWSTTQEKILIQQRLVDLHPDVILMLSGNNDIHWGQLFHTDIRWFFSYEDKNSLKLLNESYKALDHPEWIVADPVESQPISCSQVAAVAAANVEAAAWAAGRVNAQLFFVLQPNIYSTRKRLTPNEQRIADSPIKAVWNACYQALRDALSRSKTTNYHFFDLSRSFGELDDKTELFLDPYHFADLGHRLIARDLASTIDWAKIVENGKSRPF